jgi:peptidoglycan-associated lipoprotein
MSRIRILAMFCLVGALLLVFGCAPKQIVMPLSDRNSSQATITNDQEKSGRSDRSPQSKQPAIADEDLLSKAGAKAQKNVVDQSSGKKLPLDLQDIFFEFDSYTLRQKDLPILKNLSEWLLANRSAKLGIEGHCDERGTTDYNLALGQKRAEAAKTYLVGLGVDEKRMKTISYGKEAPLEQAHTEQAWERNRRVHFVLQ